MNEPDSLTAEWLETNGIGGFASATESGANTRRYHGLLTAALNPPEDRRVLLSKLEETVVIDGVRFDLATNIYTGAIHPTGYRLLKSFRVDPFPVTTFEFAGVEIEKRVFMVHGENTTVVEYRMLGEAASCTLELRPLVAFRDFHSTTHANGALNPVISPVDGCVSIQPYPDLPRLHFAHNATSVERDGNWYYRFQYPRERERGLDFEEDLFCPLTMTFPLTPGAVATVIASIAPRRAADAEALRRAEIDRRGSMNNAADQFIVTRAGDLHTVIAGYHWFGDWGRDTMIALPGLTLVTRRFDIARNILLAFARLTDQGMLPNRFEPAEYNTVDASLWFFEAIRKFSEYTGDFAWIRANLYETLRSILDWHLRGTRFGIHCASDGLIEAGSPDTQLTWMDARVNDVAITPRNGRPVEIQALWYNALRFTGALAERFDDPATRDLCDATARRTLTSFNARFWNEEAGCLYDVVSDANDASIRPNQLIALSLGYTMVDADRAARMLSVVRRELLTDFGLRTLSPADPKYRPSCSGGVFERDSAYHQGTVWPWLLGPFIDAYAKFVGKPDPRWIAKLAQLRNIPEIFDAEPPFAPRGCIEQAWSVAEILRVSVEIYGPGEVYGPGPER